MGYGTACVPHGKREYGFADTVFTWSRPGGNTDSRVFDGLAAALLRLIGRPGINTFIAAISLTHIFNATFDGPADGERPTWPLVAGILVTAVLQGTVVCIGHSAIK